MVWIHPWLDKPTTNGIRSLNASPGGCLYHRWERQDRHPCDAVISVNLDLLPAPAGFLAGILQHNARRFELIADDVGAGKISVGARLVSFRD